MHVLVAREPAIVFRFVGIEVIKDVGSAVDMEAGIRGYLLAGKENSWRPTRAANRPR